MSIYEEATNPREQGRFYLNGVFFYKKLKMENPIKTARIGSETERHKHLSLTNVFEIFGNIQTQRKGVENVKNKCLFIRLK